MKLKFTISLLSYKICENQIFILVSLAHRSKDIAAKLKIYAYSERSNVITIVVNENALV